MPLQGTFDVLGFAEVLRLVASQQMTGKLHVRSRSIGANLLVEDGCIVGADQSEHSSAPTVGDVQGRLEEVCFELLDAERGAFEFQPARPGTIPVMTKLEVDAVLERAWQRLQEWREIQQVIPSLDLQPRLVAELEQQTVTLDRDRWRLLTAVDGRRTLRAIGRSLALSDFDVCRMAKNLLEDHIIEFDGRNALLLGVPAAGGQDSEATAEPDVRLPADSRPPDSDAAAGEEPGGMSRVEPSTEEESVVTIRLPRTSVWQNGATPGADGSTVTADGPASGLGASDSQSGDSFPADSVLAAPAAGLTATGPDSDDADFGALDFLPQNLPQQSLPGQAHITLAPPPEPPLRAAAPLGAVSDLPPPAPGDVVPAPAMTTSDAATDAGHGPGDDPTGPHPVVESGAMTEEGSDPGTAGESGEAAAAQAGQPATKKARRMVRIRSRST